MRLKSLLLMSVCLMGFSMAKAEVVEIGTEANVDATTPYLPTYTWFGYSLTQQIFLNCELGRSPRTLSSISFNNTGGTRTRTIDLYLVHTSKSFFENTSDWLPFSDANKVFGGEVTFETGAWTTIAFETPFEYNGSGNVAVIVHDHSVAEENAVQFLAGYTPFNRCIFAHGSSDISLDNMSSFVSNLRHIRNQVRFNEGEVVGLPAFNSFPLTNFYKYTLSQQIYTADEIGKSGQIRSVGFYDVTGDMTRTIDLYLAHTNKMEFYNGGDWITVSNSQKVFSGTVSFKKGQWTQIELDVPFNYNGTDNLAVIVDDNTGASVRTEEFSVFPVASNQAMFYCSDASDIDATNPSAYTGYHYSFKNQIQFEIADWIEIGTAERTLDELPTTSFYNHSLTQQIYTQAELGGAKDLTSISFFNKRYERTRNLSIYLVPTYVSSFADGNSWLNFSESNKVFSGEVTFYEDCWTTIPFDTPYSYGGKTNLAVVVADNTGIYQSGMGCRGFFAMGQVLYYHTDDDVPAESLTNQTGTVNNAKNQIRFNATDDDFSRPYNLSFDELTPYYAVLTWDDDAGTKWNVQYRNYNSYDAWTTINDLTSRQCLLDGLSSSATKYHARVQRVYDDGTVSKWASMDFYTPWPMPIDLTVEPTPTSATIKWTGYSPAYAVRCKKASDYEVVFEEDFGNTEKFEEWTVYTDGEAPNSDGWVLYDKNTFIGNGAVVSYSWTGDPSTAYNADNWLITPLVDLKGTLLYWEYVAEGLYPDSYEVLLSTTGKAEGDFTQVLRPLSPGYGGWHEVRIDLSAYEGQQGYIAFHHKDVNMVNLCIDHLIIFTGEYNTWMSRETSSQTVTFDGLEPDTRYDYQVIARKPGEPNAASYTLTFTTLTNNPAPFDIAVEPGLTSADISWTGFSENYKVQYRPTKQYSIKETYFFEDFESGLDDKGWTVYTDGEAVPEYEGWFTADAASNNAGSHTYTNHSGSNVVCAKSWYSIDDNPHVLDADNWLISPKVPLKGVLSFWQWAYNQYPDSYAVLLSTTGKAKEDFTTTLRPMSPSLGDWNELTFDLSAYEGQEGYIAIHHRAKDAFYLFIDDFGIYDVEELSDTEWKEIETTATNVTIDGLRTRMEYECRIIGSKAGEEDAISDIVTFSTITPVDLVLYTEDPDGDNIIKINENNGVYANVTIQGRTFKNDGKWWSLSLPFDLELEGSILEGADLKVPEDTRMIDKYLIIDCLTPLTKIVAGIPYLIKYNGAEDIVDPVFENVKVKNSGAWISLYSNQVSFYRSYDIVPVTDDYFYVVDGTLNLVRMNLQSIKSSYAFEGYFVIDSSLNSELDGIGLNFGNLIDTITGVDDIEKTEEGSTVIYNVAGQRLDKMQKGINIVGSKKVLVK